MAEEEKPVRIPFRVKDEASNVIGKIAEATEHLGHKVDHTLSRITEMGAALTGIAGAAGFERMVETGSESLEQLKKMSALTEMSARSVAGWRDAFEQSGLHVETFSRAMLSLSKKQLSMEEGSKALTAEAKRWGVDLKSGPEKALLSMSKAVEKHKIGQAEVAKLMRVGGEEAGAMIEMLKKGPKEISEMVKHAEELNVHLADPEALERFEKFHEASVKIHQAWRLISERLVIQLAPTMTKMATWLTSHMDHIVTAMTKFGDILRKAFEFGLKHAKQISTIMLANLVLEKTIGKGLFGVLMGGGKGHGGAAGGAHGEGGAGATMRVALLQVQKMESGGGPAEAIEKKAKEAAGHAEKIWGPVRGMVRAVGGLAIMPVVAQAVAGIVMHSARLTSLVSAVGNAISKVSAVIGEIVDDPLKALGAHPGGLVAEARKKVEMFLGGGVAPENIHAIRDSADRMVAHLHHLDEDVFQKEPMLRFQYMAELENTFDKEKDAFKRRLAFANHWQAAIDEAFSNVPRTIANFLDNMGDMLKGTLPSFLEKKAVPEKGLVNYDFRGSRFDIQQKFAEGFDPDRIAVAFANDLASLGEKRLTSGLTPAFSIR